jgi:hypothetical protein
MYEIIPDICQLSKTARIAKLFLPVVNGGRQRLLPPRPPFLQSRRRLPLPNPHRPALQTQRRRRPRQHLRRQRLARQLLSPQHHRQSPPGSVRQHFSRIPRHLRLLPLRPLRPRGLLRQHGQDDSPPTQLQQPRLLLSQRDAPPRKYQPRTPRRVLQHLQRSPPRSPRHHHRKLRRRPRHLPGHHPERTPVWSQNHLLKGHPKTLATQKRVILSDGAAGVEEPVLSLSKEPAVAFRRCSYKSSPPKRPSFRPKLFTLL